MSPNPRLTITAVAALLLGAAATARAATFTVNTATDGAALLAGVCDASNGFNQCTLRAAVQAANSTPGTDTIRLPLATTLLLTLPGAGGAAQGDLDIGEDLIIDVVGGSIPPDTSLLPVIDAAALGQRIFDIPAGVTVQIRGVQLRNGEEAGGGGAIRNQGQLRVEYSVLGHNSAALGGGAILSEGAGSMLDLYDSHLLENRVDSGSGAALLQVDGQARIRRSSFVENSANAAGVGASTIAAGAGSDLSIESSYLEGYGDRPDVGVSVVDPAAVALRNITLRDFAEHTFEASSVGDAAQIDIANSILGYTIDGSCQIGLQNGASGMGVRIAWSIVASLGNCAPWAIETSDGNAQTGPLAPPSPGRVNVAPAGGGLTANTTDTGIPADAVPASPAQACVAFDALGAPRPSDGDLDGEARCDIGAAEVQHPGAMVFVVNTELDLPDFNPGDGLCDGGVLEPGYQCSLRAAVMEANANPGLDGIRFDGSGHWTIQLDQAAAAGAEGGDLDLTDALYLDALDDADLPRVHIQQSVPGERLFEIDAGAGNSVHLRGLRLSGGSSSPFSGGAIRVVSGILRLFRAEIDHNAAAADGGAISVIDANGSVVMRESDLHHNQAPGRGSNLFVGDGAYASISHSSISLGGDGGAAEREAIYVDAGGELQLVTSSIVENNGGIRALSPRRLSLFSSTIADNEGPGLEVDFSDDPNDLSMHVNLIGGNGGDDCVLLDGASANTSIHIDNWNLVADGGCVAGNPSNFAGEARLGPLTRPDGQLSRIKLPAIPVAEMAKGGVPVEMPASDAIDVAPYWMCEGSNDQRGVPRYQDVPTLADVDGPCDIGAVEVLPAPAQERIFGHGFEP